KTLEKHVVCGPCCGVRNEKPFQDWTSNSEYNYAIKIKVSNLGHCPERDCPPGRNRRFHGRGQCSHRGTQGATGAAPHPLDNPDSNRARAGVICNWTRGG